MSVNDKEILKNKYDEWNADNKDKIVSHINKHHSIYLYSQYGLGKTHFLKWLAKRYYNQQHQVYIAMFADISREIKKEIGLRKAGIFNKSLEESMRECKVLCLDDLGNENMTPNTHELLITVINFRYTNNKSTFITSNYNPEELYNIYSKAIGGVKAGQLISRIMTLGDIELLSENIREKLEYKRSYEHND